MKAIYLVTTIISFVGILILSFANWNIYSIRIFFTSSNMVLTIPFMLLAFIGFVCGASLAMYIQERKKEGGNDESEGGEGGDF